MRVDGFLGPTYPNRSVSFQSDRTINFYPELNPAPTGKSVMALIGTPGLSILCSVGSGPIRGMHHFNDKIWVVSGHHLYSVTTGGVVSAALGELHTSSGSVFIKNNGLATSGIGGNQLAIVDGVHLYIYNVNTTTFSEIATSFVPSSLSYLDGYFICTESASMRFHTSSLYDGTTWPALAVASVSSSPDNLVMCCSPHQELWLIKNYTTEVWYNNGVATTVGSPFVRVPGAVIDFGTSAPQTVIVGAGTMFMLSNSRHGDSGIMNGVAMFDGYTPIIVSPPSINYQISNMSTISDAFAYMYSQEGHTFYVITFPTGNMTFVYDLTTQMWHERSTYTSSIHIYGRHRSSCCVMVDGVIYVGDYVEGQINKMSSSYYTDNGVPISSVRIAPHLFDKENLGNIFISKLQVDVEFGTTGVINVEIYKWGDASYKYGRVERKYGSSTTTRPQALLSFSDDGGRTYGTAVPMDMGRTGGERGELMWRRLGYTRNGVCRLNMFTSNKKVITGGYAEISR